MRNLLLGIIVFMSFGLMAQLPYSWVSGTDPGWTSSDNRLIYRADCNVVTTNCNGNYASNIDSYYTSDTIDASCNNASTISITFAASGNAEFYYDFLFIEYSLNGGTTWINPYGINTGWTGNFGWLGSTIPPIIVPTSSNFMFRFNFYSDGSVTRSGYKILDFDIVCNVVLPVNLTSFTGENKNGLDIISWETETETNNDYFTLEHSADGKVWNEIRKVKGAGNSTTTRSYQENNRAQENDINYYRLTQIDYDGKSETFDILAIKNESIVSHVYSKESGEILFSKIYKYELYNSMGQLMLKGESNKVNVKGLSQGVYILKAGSNIQKFFIN